MDRTASQDMPAGRRPRRSIVAVALAALLAVPAAVTLPATPAAASACPTAAGSYAGGDGSAGDPFRIATPAELVKLSGDTANFGKAFRLTRRSITGLTVDFTSSNLGDRLLDEGAGFFGVVEGDAIVQDLVLSGTVTVTPRKFPILAGGLIGFYRFSAGSSLIVRRVDVDVDVSASGRSAGGLIGKVGDSDADASTTVTIEDVTVSGDFTAPQGGSSQGGVIGHSVRCHSRRHGRRARRRPGCA
jgi:hypothetical protein